MRNLRGYLARFGELFRRKRRDQELAEELESHLQLHIDDNLRAGMTPVEARRQALVKFGGMEATVETYRERRGFSFGGTLIQDLRYAVRVLSRSPGVTGVVLLSLSLGIGANTAIFSLLNAVVLKPLPVPHPEQLVQFSETSSQGRKNYSMSYPFFERIRNRNQTLSDVFAFSSLRRVNVSFDGKSDFATGQVATEGYFSTLELTPAAGRFFTDDDDKGRRPVAVISYPFWQRRFGGDASIVGKAVTLNHVPVVVVGVTPRTFFGVEVGNSPDITVPMALASQLSPMTLGWSDPFDVWIEIMGRLKPGITGQQAQAEFDVIHHQFQADSLLTVEPGKRQGTAAWLGTLRLTVEAGAAGFESGLRHGFSTPLQILMMMVVLVLLIACANVANLLLARATARKKEIAVRLAIGASRARLLRQLLTESILLAVTGGFAGFLISGWGSHLLVRMVSTGDSPVSVDLTPDARILAFTTCVSLLTGVLFGLAPALRATRINLTPALKEAGSGGLEGRRRALGLDTALIVAQVALSLTLLVGAGLFVHSLQKLWAIDPGYNRNNLLMFSLDPRLAGYAETSAQARLHRQLLENIRALPEVRSVSLSLVRPVDDAAYWVDGIGSIDGRKLTDQERVHVAANALGPGYFENLGTPMLLGREFGLGDNETTQKVAVISETLARQCFGNSNPMGRRIADDDQEFQIVGVVKDSRYGNVRDVPRSVLYVAFFQANLGEAFFDTTFEVRYTGSVSTVLNEIGSQLRAIDSNLPLIRVKTLEVQTRDSFVKERLISSLATFFGLVAVLLACIGLYGTMSYRVGRRTGEIGVRLALGAQQNDIVLMVLREVASLIVIGVAVGLPCAVMSSRILASQLFAVKPTDVLTLSLSSLLLVMVALLAGFLPARRASRVDPMVALRCE